MILPKPEIFLARCPKCARKTAQRIYKANRKRGLKLSCLECGHVKNRYSKPHTLIKFSGEKNDEV